MNYTNEQLLKAIEKYKEANSIGNPDFEQMFLNFSEGYHYFFGALLDVVLSCKRLLTTEADVSLSITDQEKDYAMICLPTIAKFLNGLQKKQIDVFLDVAKVKNSEKLNQTALVSVREKYIHYI